MSDPTTQTTPYERMGGHDTFVRLVRGFYERVALDPALRALYPEEDLGPAEIRLRMFLEQYWGGPNTYSQQRGHPRLRMRHTPYAVTPEQRDRWLRHMLASVADVGLDREQEATLVDYLVRAADMLVNAPEEAYGIDKSPETDQSDQTEQTDRTRGSEGLAT